MTEEPVALPQFVIASLYANSLVEIIDTVKEEETASLQISESKEEDTQNKKAEFHFLGENKKNIGIIVSEADAEFLNDSDLTLLTNIMGACKFTLSDIAIFNQLKHALVFNDVKDKLEMKYFILFGVEPIDIKIPFSIPHFQVQQYAGLTIVTAPPLAQMNTQTEAATGLRRQLWESLKRVFGIQAKK